MTLRDTLLLFISKGVPSVKVKTKNGSSYFYACTLTEDSLKDIETIGEEANASFRKLLNAKKRQFKNLDKHYDDMIEKERRVLDPLWVEMQLHRVPDDEATKRRRGYQKRAKNIEKTIASFVKKRESLRNSLPIKIKYYERMVQLYKPYLDREVVDFYDGILFEEEPNNINIVIEGNENGEYWCIKEYKKHLEELKRQEIKQLKKGKKAKKEEPKKLSIAELRAKIEKELERKAKEEERLRNLWTKEQQVK